MGFKAFMCNSGLAEFARADDTTLHAGMREAARLRLPVAVHAETEEITKGLTERLTQAGQTDIRAFLASRPVAAEVDAIERAGRMARETGCHLHVVHISSGRGVAAALEARAAGADISIETCPHYLFFTGDDMLRLGAVAKCAPPLRREQERESLWKALARGDVDIIGSDHSPCLPELKDRANFFEVWAGLQGVQSTLSPVLLNCLGGPHRLTLDRIAQLTAANPARRFGIPNKGTIAVGQHADLTLADLNTTAEVRPEKLLQRHPVSPYVGQTLRGVIRSTYRRGEVPHLFRWKNNSRDAGTQFVRPETTRYAESS